MIEIGAAHRDVLYERIFTHMSGIGDVWLSAARGDFETADRLAREFSDELRLLIEGLGWGHDRNEPMELSSPPDVIRRAIERLKDESDAQRRHEEPEWELSRNMEDQHERLAEACDAILADLGDESPPPSSPPGR